MPKTLTRQHRSRLISFRVTEAELDELVSACTTSDARSLSDFARHAALDLARRGRSPSGLDGTLTRLNATLTEIMILLRPDPPRTPTRDYAAPPKGHTQVRT